MTKQELHRRTTNMVKQHKETLNKLSILGIDKNIFKQNYEKGKYEYFIKHLDTVFNRRFGND
jgi:hypothetical protein